MRNFDFENYFNFFSSSNSFLYIDHDECQDTGMCNNGHCINMNGSFKCKCNDGYVLSPTRNTCIGKSDSFLPHVDSIKKLISQLVECVDINECAENPRICLNGRCENTPGSYHCICQPGFTPSRDNTFCVDMDECSTSGMCENGKCVNMEGSFKCVCDSGFRIGPDQSHCIGVCLLLSRLFFVRFTIGFRHWEKQKFLIVRHRRVSERTVPEWPLHQHPRQLSMRVQSWI